MGKNGKVKRNYNNFYIKNKNTTYKCILFSGYFAAITGLSISYHGIPYLYHHFPINLYIYKLYKCRKKCFAFKKIVDFSIYDIDYFMSEANNFIDVQEIMSLLPHRYPFILIDRIMDINIGKDITAIKNVTINENFFQGHFPSKPIMPGVLIIESMAQAAGVLGIKTMQSMNPEAKDFMVYFMSIEEAKFRKFVTPGDTLIHKIEVLKQRSKMFKLSCKSYVGDEIVTEATISAMLEVK